MIARELVEAMGGKLDVDSAPGVGTCFWFSIPLRIADRPDEQAAIPSGPQQGGVQAVPLPDGPILLVDDNPVNQQLAGAMLARLGLVFDTAGDGRECTARLQGKKYAAVLMDVEMPVMDGITATRLIRERETATGNPRLPIIAMTANALNEDRDRCIAAGMDGFIPKPIGLKTLDAELRRVLGPSDRLGPVPAAAPQAKASDQSALASDLGTWDRSSMLADLEGDEELVGRLAAMFVRDVPIRLREMDLSIETDDWATLVRTAHTLKGLFGTFAAGPARAAALRMETAAKGVSPQAAELQPLAASVRQHAEGLIAELAKEAPAGASASG